MRSPSVLSRLLVASSFLALASAVVIGCSVETSTGGPGADAGTTPTGDAGDAGTAACSTEGTGTIALVVNGLPEGVAAKVKIIGPGTTATPIDATASTSLADRAAGTYDVTAESVTAPDPVVRTLYRPAITFASATGSGFCLGRTKTETVTVDYSAHPASHKLWMANANPPGPEGQVLAFGGGVLGATGSPSAALELKGSAGNGAGKAIAFDRDGNMWTLGGTTSDASLVRFSAGSFLESGEKIPDRRMGLEIGCVPGPSALAFDPSGALWVSILCEDRVLRLGPEAIAQSRELTPAAGDFATGVNAPRSVAFDQAGNMWVSGDGGVRRFPAASLAADQPHVSDLTIALQAENTAALPADVLAFDGAGNLWVSSFGANAIMKLTPANLERTAATKTLTPSVILTIGVTALLEGLAFDESGGLWLSYSQGKLARLAPAQLGTSTTPGDPSIPSTVVTSADIGSASGMAFFPAAAMLPLYGRHP